MKNSITKILFVLLGISFNLKAQLYLIDEANQRPLTIIDNPEKLDSIIYEDAYGEAFKEYPIYNGDTIKTYIKSQFQLSHIDLSVSNFNLNSNQLASSMNTSYDFDRTDSGYPYDSVIYKYDNKDNIDSIITEGGVIFYGGIYPQTRTKSKFEYVGGVLNHSTRLIIDWNNDTTWDTTVYHHNELGDLTEVINLDMYHRITYTYNELGNVLLSTGYEYDFYNNNWIPFYTYKYMWTPKTITSLKSAVKLRTSCYPNPADNYIIINGLENANQVRIIDFNGRVVKNKLIKTSTSNLMLDISDLTPGTYILNSNFDSEIESLRFVKR